MVTKSKKDSPEVARLKGELRRAEERIVELEESLGKASGRIVEFDVALAQARGESRTDSLTGLPNLRAFNETLEKEVARSRRHGSPLVVVYTDFDYLKSVNDLYGHPAGNEVIKRFGSVICSSLREEDSCARLHGDEFALILPATSEAKAKVIVERLAQQVREHVRIADGEDTPKASASFGYAELLSEEEVADFLKRVDNNLYSWKLRHRPAFRGGD